MPAASACRKLWRPAYENLQGTKPRFGQVGRAALGRALIYGDLSGGRAALAGKQHEGWGRVPRIEPVSTANSPAIEGKRTGNFAESGLTDAIFEPNPRAHSRACSKIPYATEQGIFGGITGNFFQRTGNSRQFLTLRGASPALFYFWTYLVESATGILANIGKIEPDGARTHFEQELAH
jgi:hypothetical protein